MELDYRVIGRRIAKRRKSLGLTQAVVEEKAALGQKYLSSIETGKSIPSTEVIMRLAAALETTPDEFLVGTARPAGEDAWSIRWAICSCWTGWPVRGLRAFWPGRRRWPLPCAAAR